MQHIELLAPAKDIEAARAAILCGADAVYLGAPQFSARQAAGNSLDAIARVLELAAPYYVKVYVALNTLLFDAELPQAEAMIRQLYDLGIDGLIIQDVGLLELDLPPVTLIASTQMHNNTPEKVKFLEDVGFSRVILARELTLEQIREIRRQTSVELECFVHGALCVCESGRCAMSYALGGRSGNRGRCAQPCRRRYTLKDPDGSVISRNRYLLSLKDLNLSERLEDLLGAGICSFKIEGRLKEAPYVANTVGFYRQKLDAVLSTKGLQKSSSGAISLHFTPNPEKTFNRGFTEYGLIDTQEPVGSIHTPKSIGQRIGTVTEADRRSFSVDSDMDLHNGDGICFFDAENILCGTQINRVEGGRVFPQNMDGIQKGTLLFRNYDHQFIKSLQGRFADRNIRLHLTLRDIDNGLELLGTDEDGNTAAFSLAMEKEPARQPDAARQRISEQLAKLGNTFFVCDGVVIQTKEAYFVPVSVLNSLKRGLVEQMTAIRMENSPKNRIPFTPNSTDYPTKKLDWKENILNEKARAFYRRHGIIETESAAEAGLDLHGRTVMTTKYCIRKQLGLCEPNAAPLLLLTDEDGREFRIRFRCGACGMELDWIA